MLRKCAFVLLSIFLRSYGASPQVVAASMVLIMAMSARDAELPEACMFDNIELQSGIIFGASAPVSYTHLTLPTIYSV